MAPVWHLVQIANAVCVCSISTGLARRMPLCCHDPGIRDLCDQLLGRSRACIHARKRAVSHPVIQMFVLLDRPYRGGRSSRSAP
jgi:hypothetical protein